MLAQDEPEDRFLIHVGGVQNKQKVDPKTKQFSDIPRNLVFCEWSSEKLRNENPKPLQNRPFSGKG